ncbi:MAG: tRNA-dihydrouridine synthase family protein [Planctomycetes bacterium]|nr:tRNA-dihydrouridine synthase family protein [Planctomycetota bacterium]
MAFDAERAAHPIPTRLRFDGLTIGFPVVQAALSGYSDWPMRAVARAHGADYAVCEVMLDQFLIALRNRRKTRHFLHIGPDEHPVGGQLMGSEPDQFAHGARRLVDAGFDVIDINFGCPVRKVLGRCRGGFHLSQPVTALEIIRRTRDAVPAAIPVTLKMRRGIDDSQSSRDRFFTILDGAFAEGVAAVTVHPRTVEQGYAGPSRWDFLRDVKRHVGARVILGSGDLFSARDCIDMMTRTGVDGVTAARGAIGNPWIFRQARELAADRPLPPPPTVREQRDVLRAHVELAVMLHGPDRAIVSMRKSLARYAASHPEYLDVRSELVRVGTLDDLESVIDRWYARDRAGRYPEPVERRGEREARDG